MATLSRTGSEKEGPRGPRGAIVVVVVAAATVVAAAAVDDDVVLKVPEVLFGSALVGAGGLERDSRALPALASLGLASNDTGAFGSAASTADFGSARGEDSLSSWMPFLASLYDFSCFIFKLDAAEVSFFSPPVATCGTRVLGLAAEEPRLNLKPESPELLAGVDDAEASADAGAVAVDAEGVGRVDLGAESGGKGMPSFFSWMPGRFVGDVCSEDASALSFPEALMPKDEAGAAALSPAENAGVAKEDGPAEMDSFELGCAGVAFADRTGAAASLFPACFLCPSLLSSSSFSSSSSSTTTPLLLAAGVLESTGRDFFLGGAGLVTNGSSLSLDAGATTEDVLSPIADAFRLDPPSVDERRRRLMSVKGEGRTGSAASLLASCDSAFVCF